MTVKELPTIFAHFLCVSFFVLFCTFLPMTLSNMFICHWRSSFSFVSMSSLLFAIKLASFWPLCSFSPSLSSSKNLESILKRLSAWNRSCNRLSFSPFFPSNCCFISKFASNACSSSLSSSSSNRVGFFSGRFFSFGFVSTADFLLSMETVALVSASSSSSKMILLLFFDVS